jgi:hypothetical protein
MSSEIEIRDYQQSDIGPVLDLVQLGLGGGPTGAREETFWKWKHWSNPFGKSIALVAASREGQIVGLRTFMRWQFQSGSKTLKAVRAVDTVTHPDFRRYGVFSSLTTKAIERTRESNVDLIFNTPNDDVLPGYLKLGWNKVGFVRPWINILNPPRFAAGIIRNRSSRKSLAQVAPQDFFRDTVSPVSEFLGKKDIVEEALRCRNKVNNGQLSTEQSLNYLRWRYSEFPKANYFVVHHRMNSDLSGFIILRTNLRFGLKEILISEMLLSKPDVRLASGLIRELKHCASADYLITFFPGGSFNRRAIVREGFFPVPLGGMNFTVNPLSAPLEPNPNLMRNWNLSLGDLEVF